MEDIQGMIEAVKKGDMDGVKALLAHDPDLARARDASGVSVVLLAVYYGHDPIAETLVDSGVELDIFEAAALGKMTRVVQLLKLDPRLANAFAPDGFTPLGLASFFGHQTVAKTLLGRGADVNLASSNDLQVHPVNSAVAHRHLALAELLLEAGADVNAREQGGYTPLHEAADNGQFEMVKLLLAHGADVTCASQDGKTALDLAEARGERNIAALLKQASPR
jgi:uncharacterized protein